MDKYPGWLFQLILTLLIIKSTQSQGTSCINPIKLPGHCVNINNCPPLLDLYRTYGNSVADFLRSSQCGWEGQDPKVCCPTSEPPIESTTIGVRALIPESTRPKPYGPLLAPQCGSSNGPIVKVVGGNPAKLGAWPWMAVLGYRATRRSNEVSWLCGGTLISSRHVLTAAHCVHERQDLYIVRLGDLNLDDNVDDGAHPVNILIENTTIHPDFNRNYFTNDIAMIRLAQDVQFTPNLQPICLPFVKELVNKDFVGSEPYIAGWGSVYYRGPTSDYLQEAQPSVIEQEKCVNAFRRFNNSNIDYRVMCAGKDAGGISHCEGDSGGPMMYPVGTSFYIIGIVSYSWRCAEPGIPGIYTKVGAFTDFIISHLD